MAELTLCSTVFITLSPTDSGDVMYELRKSIKASSNESRLCLPQESDSFPS